MAAPRAWVWGHRSGATVLGPPFWGHRSGATGLGPPVWGHRVVPACLGASGRLPASLPPCLPATLLPCYPKLPSRLRAQVATREVACESAYDCDGVACAAVWHSSQQSRLLVLLRDGRSTGTDLTLRDMWVHQAPPIS